MFASLFHHRSLTALNSVDLHSHLIPGIDDGSKDMETSIALIEELIALGYTKLITTPHISDLFPNTKETILDGFDEMVEEVKRRELDIILDVGAEYYVNEHFFQLLEREEILSFGAKQYVLIEFSYFTPPQDLDNTVYEITRRGYAPILAHPERYLYWHDDFDVYQEMREMGVLLQLNLNSINGYYGEGIQLVAERMIKQGMVDCVGSDTHHKTHIAGLKKSLAESLYKKIFKYNKILNDTL